jgi:hypothetical protein
MREWKIVKTEIKDGEDLFINELKQWESKGWMVHPESFNARLETYYVLLSKE